MASDPYLYKGTNVLANKLGIRDSEKLAHAESEFSTARITQLESNPVRGNFDYKHLQAVHQHIFQDVYEWAGKPRVIGISKAEPILGGRSVAYPHPQSNFPPDNLAARAEFAFNQLKRDNFLKDLPRDQFISKLTRHSAEIWEVHPFREGNTRTVLAFTSQLSRQAGYTMEPKLWSSPRELRDAFVHAADGRDTNLRKLFESVIPSRDRDYEKTRAAEASIPKPQPAAKSNDLEKSELREASRPIRHVERSGEKPPSPPSQRPRDYGMDH